jgi:hypothetical protein
LALEDGGCTDGASDVTCTWEISGTVGLPGGTYTITVEIEDDDDDTAQVETVLLVEPEDATAWFDAGNPLVLETDDGGDSPSFTITAYVSETLPDVATYGAVAGDIGKADVTVVLEPMIAATPVEVPCSESVSGSGYSAVLEVTCTYDNVPVDLYTIDLQVGGGYYAGSADDLLVVYDPEGGSASGGGSFIWPGSDDRTIFAFTMKQGKGKKGGVQGSLMVMRRTDEGTVRLRSNALDWLTLGEAGDPTFGWAVFSGKATIQDADSSQGANVFTVHVQDHGEPGAGVDTLWIEVEDRSGAIVEAMSMPGDGVPLDAGNIVVPHGVKKKKK